ncbi:ornithine decarboxylase, putative [Talaromyces stipitatus ATCC 10500]|uniref:ornithine decarboxylase n=1 Tax=Talaromyces stipitatus (strain ATCC 10500 / CBS 375.48 / QM 6759 / NRRL 1006) TaxID=441959 RepID=B8MUR6_TALSN|nr:ornithine decarboxylase, putative [Talaromyces stipitatus ATCC 10500]EED11804.1 ornithine decarboxylase, putative [Talaromyces stipitatus ATCC 10500]
MSVDSRNLLAFSRVDPLCSTFSNLPIDTCRGPFQSTGGQVEDAIYGQIAQIEQYPRTSQPDASFFVADLGEIRRQHSRWMSHLPNIMPFFAVKCNPDVELLQVLKELGVGFDCASVEEMQTVLRLGAPSTSIIFANPCKTPHALAFAHGAGIKMTTFDNLDELDTIKNYMPDARLLLRIFANDSNALVALGEKFGALPDSIQDLLMRAKDLNLNVVGISFHIGSGASDPSAFQKAIAHSRQVWDSARSMGFFLQILDIGGGFQPTEAEFTPMATAIQSAISEASFPGQTIFMAEPGRFFARSVFTLVCRIISCRKSKATESPQRVDMLYQNDGVYGNFMNALIEREDFAPSLIITKGHLPRKSEYHAYTIWGPTCDSTDCVSRKASFALLRGMLTGKPAYTSATATNFNGFSSKTKTIYTPKEKGY